jgi:hypothetical protein
MAGMEKTIDPIDVMMVKAKGGTKGAKEAFKVLESTLPGFKGRRCYGVYDIRTGEYRACVQTTKGDDAASLGLETWVIPGGMYETRKVIDWISKIPQLPEMFDEMAQSRKVDPDRPSLEFYRSESELVLYLPIIE